MSNLLQTKDKWIFFTIQTMVEQSGKIFISQTEPVSTSMGLTLTLVILWDKKNIGDEIR